MSCKITSTNIYIYCVSNAQIDQIVENKCQRDGVKIEIQTLEPKADNDC